MSRVVVSGIGIVRSPDEDAAAGSESPRARPFEAFALDDQIPNRPDQRAMGRTMQAAVVAAGRALSQAGLRESPDLLADTQILTAGRCTERDDALDAQLLADGGAGAQVGALTAALRQGLRPSLFLTQLPNLISANISIVHGVTGCSQTFLGEEGAGIEAVATGFDRIAGGSAVRCLVGGVFSAEGASFLEAAGAAPASRRVGRLGSAAAFLLLEAEASAQARSHRPLARMRRHLRLSSEQRPLHTGEIATDQLWSDLMDERPHVVLSAARDDPASRDFESKVCARAHNVVAPGAYVARLSDRLGSTFEASAPTALATALELLAAAPAGEVQRAVVVNLAGERSGSAVVMETMHA